MNWTIILVILVLGTLIPAALYAAFTSSKDSYSFKEHYSESGFSAEVARSAHAQTQLPQGSLRASEPPVVEWPDEF